MRWPLFGRFPRSSELRERPLISDRSVHHGITLNPDTFVVKKATQELPDELRFLRIRIFHC